MDIRIRTSAKAASNILKCLLTIEITLAIIYFSETILGSPSHLLHDIFAFDNERTLPNWFSAVQLSIVGLIFLHFTFNVPSLKPYRQLFAVMSLGFIFLSLDENISLHERITYRFSDVEWLPRFKGDHGIWISVYLTIAVILLLTNLKQLLNVAKQFPKNARLFAAGGALYISGGILLEIIGYSIVHGEDPGTAYYLEVTAEEFLEMAGVTVMLYSTLLPPASSSAHPE